MVYFYPVIRYEFYKLILYLFHGCSLFKSSYVDPTKLCEWLIATVLVFIIIGTEAEYSHGYSDNILKIPFFYLIKIAFQYRVFHLVLF